MIFGDFNDVLNRHKKCGGRERPEKQMEDFRRVVDDCKLIDMGYDGVKYTWCNRTEVNNIISFVRDWIHFCLIRNGVTCSQRPKFNMVQEPIMTIYL